MSFGRIPGLLLAVIIMGGLLMLVIWTKASEQKARAVFLQEVRSLQRLRGGRVDLLQRLFREETPEMGSGLQDRIRKLYPKYLWRWRLIRLRLEVVKRIIWARSESRLYLPPLGIVLLPMFAEALRQRELRQSGLIVFPNELIFNFGLWVLSLGMVGLVTGYLLSPAALPPYLIIGLLTLMMALGLTATIAHIPGRFNDDK